MAFAFGDYELDVAAYELRHCGEPVAVQPKVFDTLRYLIERRGQIVSKEELLDALWGGGNVNRVAVPWSISHARKALGQRGGDAVPIETVRGRGYRFVSEVRRVTQAPPSSRGLLDSQAVAEARTRRAGEPFLGRDDVMDRLTNALNEARAGRGRLVLLTGEAGIGKTRCANEMASAARRSGLSVWVGRCAGGGGVPSFWPWIQILRACTEDSRVSTPDRKAAEAMLARLAPAAADDGARPSALSESSRFWLS
ncbi:MAG TPA: winged helix-turn-helix domain-containing protein, partial [Polyangiaceae bacterium]|nr:winged helix-turn-helix domain-containing protein [Polyangiaceae bacterium]